MRLLDTPDIKYLWAAYKTGGFPNIQQGMTMLEFKQASEAQLLSYDVALLLSAYNGGAVRPVGMILGYLSGHRMEPHATWFPWATARNKLETIVHFINESRRNYLVLVYAWGENQKFFIHLGKYGILKQVALIPHWFGPKEDALFFVSKGFRPELSKPE